jgi:hypothetical protein
MPLKLKLFAWLAGLDKLLTWAALQRRGWMGPSICLLCRSGPEDLLHLLIYCPFSKVVWQQASNFFSLQIPWRGSSINDASLVGSAQNRLLTVWWYISVGNYGWRGIVCSLRTPSHHCKGYSSKLCPLSSGNKTLQRSPSSCYVLDLAEGHTLAFFDGAAQSNGARCGAGGFFKTHQSRTLIGSSTVARVQIQKLSSWAFGPRSLSPLYGLSMTSTSREIRE